MSNNNFSQKLPLHDSVNTVLQEARQFALKYHHALIDSEHLLLGIIAAQNPLISAALQSVKTSARKLRSAVLFVITHDSCTVDPQIGNEVERILDRANYEAIEMMAREIKIEHVFLGMLQEEETIAYAILHELHITYDNIFPELVKLSKMNSSAIVTLKESTNRFQLTPTLNMVSRDLSAEAQAGRLEPLIGREYELERVMQTLTRRSKNNPVLIGEAGVGKTAIAEGLAQRIADGNAPPELLRQRVVSLDTGLLTIGTKFRGDFEERLKSLVAEIIKVHNLIIVVDELHTLIGSGVAEGSIDAANLLKPILARGEFRCFGATTLDDYRKTIEKDPALERRFQPIFIRPSTPEETKSILFGLRPRYEAFHRVAISDEAIEAAVKLADRYVHVRQFPDKAIDLIDEAAARSRVQRSVIPAEALALSDSLDLVRCDKNMAIEKGEFAIATALWKKEKAIRRQIYAADSEWRTQRAGNSFAELKATDVAEIVSSRTGVPAIAATEQEAERLLRLEELLHAHIVGQQKAVSATAQAIRRSRADIRDRRRPIGSFIFAGPTGVGKTALAKALAKAFFNDEQAIVTIDMSEFTESHYAARLVGSPPGYVGYDQAGQLTEAVKRRPYTIVLLDEIEKAHPRIYDLLLQVLEDGCLSDAKGQQTDFSNTIIIMTTNIGAQLKPFSGGFIESEENRTHNGKETAAQKRLKRELAQTFKPEFLNRIDSIIVFDQLTRQDMRQLCDIALEPLIQRMRDRLYDLQIDAAAREELARQGYSSEYGARPLLRMIQSSIEDVLAEKILRNELQPGGGISISAIDGKFIFTISPKHAKQITVAAESAPANLRKE